jgi:hypothetical protein
MSFFDPKEDVMQIELTRHGIELLKQGKFFPSYYVFYDDDILYDATSASMTEAQKDAEPRILSETAALRPMKHFVGSDKACNTPSEDLEMEGGQYIGQFAGIGRMASTASELELPRWDVKMGNGLIDTVNSTPYRDDGVLDQNDNPQIIVTDIEYKWINEKSGYDLDKIPVERKYAFPDKTVIAVTDDYLLVDLQELGVDFLNDNFEIELFEIKEIMGEEKSIPLYFFKKSQTIENEILLDEDKVVKYNQDKVITDTKLVDYYLDVMMDEEIPTNIVCSYDQSLRKNDKTNIFVQDDGIMILGTQGRTCVVEAEGEVVSQYQIRKESDLGDKC